MSTFSITVVVPTKNESKNLPHCLGPLKDWAQQVVIVDSASEDETVPIAQEFGATVLQFKYNGGWPKKRQYVLDTFPFRTQWVLLLDADEILSFDSKVEIAKAIQEEDVDGYYLWFHLEFLGRVLKRSDPGLRKLSLFRTGKGKFEKRFANQDATMGDMEVHEHVIVDGQVGELKTSILHRNWNSLSRFIIKHDEYSNYECKVHTSGEKTELKERFFGKKEERRRFLKKYLIRNPISPVLYFVYLYVFRMGFLEGMAGFYYVLYQCIYLYFVSSKIYEAEHCGVDCVPRTNSTLPNNQSAN